MKGFKLKRTDGFTLIELMVAVMIIGILAMLAMPRYRAVVANARMSEAKTNLSTIGKLQQAFQLRTHGRAMKGYAEGDYCCRVQAGGTIGTQGAIEDIRYGGHSSTCDSNRLRAKNQLGFRITDCEKARYTYQIEATAEDTAHGGRAVQGVGAATVRLTNPLYPNCETPTTNEIDEWSIAKDTWVLEHTNDVIANCEDDN